LGTLHGSRVGPVKGALVDALITGNLHLDIGVLDGKISDHRGNKHNQDGNEQGCAVFIVQR
jgi:hypothetical protein